MVATAVALALLTGSPLAASQCESAPAFPDPPASVTKLAPEPDYETARHIEGYADAYLGIGHLEVEGEAHYNDWYRYVTIPFYRTPGGAHVGWLQGGWVLRDGARKSLTLAGTTETDYERATLIVLEESDGWIRLRYDKTTPEDSGTAWTHRCALSLGTVSLSVRLWRDLFSREGHPPLYFRKDVPHALRVGPGIDHERLTWIGTNDEVEPVEIRGNWMRVTLYQPGKFHTLCGGAEEWNGRARTGWIQWWDESSGPWLFWFTRGC